MNTQKQNNVEHKIYQQGYDKAIELLHFCLTEHGFIASTTELHNYHRVWGRDGCIMGLAGLVSGKEELIKGCRDTLQTLIKYQGPHGEIPSNVDPVTERISYG